VQRDFLPAPYNDFIFAIIAEEYGLVGALLLLFGFCVLLFRGYLRIARDAPDPLGLFLATGLTTMIVAYGFVHAGVACGLLPVTGLPMPFVSYGGSSLLANGVMVGVLLNISRQVESRTSPAARGATAKTV
jgi:cell division protein FtsW